MKQVPEKLTGYSVFLNGTDYLGVANVTLPSFEAMTASVTGAGIAGEIDSPSVGLFGPMSCALNWRTIEQTAARLQAPVSHAIDFRGNQQTYDTVAGQYLDVGVKVSVRAVPKTFNLGNFEQNAVTDSSNEFEITYIKVVINGKIMIELDKYNFIYIVNGVDYMAAKRANLGL